MYNDQSRDQFEEDIAMEVQVRDPLRWFEHSMQGLAFWMGHRHSLYRHYPLTEGALVAEACNLLYTNLPNSQCLLAERKYVNLVDRKKIDKLESKSIRADLVICNDIDDHAKKDGNITSHVLYAVEIKRGSAPIASIYEDMKRLHTFRRLAARQKRAFLIIACEKGPNNKFIKNGKSVLGKRKIPDCEGYFRVTRTVKAASSFLGKSTAHYVCIIEIFLASE